MMTLISKTFFSVLENQMGNISTRQLQISHDVSMLRQEIHRFPPPLDAAVTSGQNLPQGATTTQSSG